MRNTLGALTRLILTSLLFNTALSVSDAAIYYISPTGSDTNIGTMAKPFLTIQKGITRASSGDTIKLEDGTFTGTGDIGLDPGSKNLSFGSVDGSAKTIIDCGGESTASRAFTFDTSKSTESVNGITIQNGYATFVNGGAAIDVESGCTVAITNCTLSNNNFALGSSTGGGGAIYDNGVLTLNTCIFQSNDAYTGGQGGAGVYVDSLGQLTATDSSFSNNRATFGGAISSLGPVTLTDCDIESNGGQYEGGGLCLQNKSTVTDCTISQNGSDMGGGIYVGGSTSIVGCTIYNNNSPDGYGAGIYVSLQGSATLSDTTLTSNYSEYGGGLYNSTNTAVMTNCVIASNDASVGGGVYNGGIMKLLFCTFTANAGSGALENDATATLTNDIFWNDTAQSVDEINVGSSGSPTTSVTYCDVDGGFIGTGNIDKDPLFVNAPDDLHVAAASPCVGAGITISGITNDLDGNVRPNPPTIGAYEGAAHVATLTFQPAKVVGGKNTTGKVTLTYAAPTGGVTVMLTSKNSAVLSVPSSVVVPADSTTATFTATTTGVATDTRVMVSATYAGVTKTATVTITGISVASITLSPTSVPGGSAAQGTVTLQSPASAATTVTLSSNNANAKVPTSVTIAAGASSATFSIATTAVSSSNSALITATLNGVSKSATMTITAPSVAALIVSPSEVISGSSATGIVSLRAPAPVGGLKVALTSGGSAAKVPASITVPAGKSSVTFTITTISVTMDTIVSIGASTSAGSESANLTILPLN